MMGWAMLVAIAALTALVLWLIGFPKRLWTIPATALTLGAAGYAWQGNPGLPGRPVATAQAAGEVDPELVALREAMFGRFNLSWGYFAQADAMTRIGAKDTAVRAMLNAVRASPNDTALWTGLGYALAEHDKGISPAARFAFDRAMALYPQHPGPPFFYGQALIRANQFAEARPFWAKALALAPKDASYRDDIAVRVMLLDRFLAEMQAREGASPPASPEGEGPSPAPAGNDQAQP
jgi:tetratricopeptide (TPR) repeat protein